MIIIICISLFFLFEIVILWFVDVLFVYVEHNSLALTVTYCSVL